MCVQTRIISSISINPIYDIWIKWKHGDWQPWSHNWKYSLKMKKCSSNMPSYNPSHLLHFCPPSLFCAFSRVVQSPLSMPWPTMYSVFQQLVAYMELAMSPLQTMLPTQPLWLLFRRMQQLQLQHMEDTLATLCHKPSLQRPSSCLYTMCTRHIDCACI